MMVVFAIVVIRSARIEFALFRCVVIEVVRARAYFRGSCGELVTSSSFPHVSQYQHREGSWFSNRGRAGGSNEEFVYHGVLISLSFCSLLHRSDVLFPPNPPPSCPYAKHPNLYTACVLLSILKFARYLSFFVEKLQGSKGLAIRSFVVPIEAECDI